MLSVIYLVLVSLFVPWVTLSNRQTVFYEAALEYQDEHYIFSFKKIEDMITKIEVECDENKILNLNNVKGLNQIDLPDLNVGSHQIKIEYKLINKGKKNVNFIIEIPTEVNITNQAYFSLNSLVKDYENKVEFIENQYLQIEELKYEIIQEGSYIDFKNFGDIYYKNNNHALSKSIEYIIFNPLYYYNYPYEKGYHFFLNLIKDGYVNHLDFKNSSFASPLVDKLYLPKQSMDNIIDSRIVFHNIFNSRINVYFDQIIDIEHYLFYQGGDFSIYVEDLI